MYAPLPAGSCPLPRRRETWCAGEEGARRPTNILADRAVNTLTSPARPAVHRRCHKTPSTAKKLGREEGDGSTRADLGQHRQEVAFSFCRASISIVPHGHGGSYRRPASSFRFFFGTGNTRDRAERKLVRLAGWSGWRDLAGQAETGRTGWLELAGQAGSGGALVAGRAGGGRR